MIVVFHKSVDTHCQDKSRQSIECLDSGLSLCSKEMGRISRVGCFVYFRRLSSLHEVYMSTIYSPHALSVVSTKPHTICICVTCRATDLQPRPSLLCLLGSSGSPKGSSESNSFPHSDDRVLPLRNSFPFQKEVTRVLSSENLFFPPEEGCKALSFKTFLCRNP